ncbi:hypothetical protein NM688_g7294 [Phlebia brevispora]|uniref:Uncharacterized protein n=1 Tax=Phlebia brevispora TaxID=194682 RepID=A0ACC1S7F3_9APHY|nr:hypothetical protein NM688_g7294 [Phlebia brevispora]
MSSLDVPIITPPQTYPGEKMPAAAYDLPLNLTRDLATLLTLLINVYAVSSSFPDTLMHYARCLLIARVRVLHHYHLSLSTTTTMSFFGASTSTATPATIPDKDIEVADPPTDSISSIAFSPQQDYLAVGSWDNNVRIYEIGSNGQSVGKAMYGHQGPVLSVCWNKDGTKILSGGADNAGRMFDVTTGQSTQVAQHEAPIKSVKWIDMPGQGGFLATGSWDKTVKYWDIRSPAPVSSVQLPERCYTLDVVYPLMVVGTAERHIQIFNLSNPTTAYKTLISPLKWQTRVVSCFPTANGFAGE